MRKGTGPKLGPLPLAKASPPPSRPEGLSFHSPSCTPRTHSGPLFVQQNLQSSFSAPAVTLRHEIAVAFTVSGLEPSPHHGSGPAVWGGTGERKEKGGEPGREG